MAKKSTQNKSKAAPAPRRKRGRRALPVDGPGAKERILQAFLEICYESGPDQVTLQKLADRTEVSLGTVRYYFAEKDIALYQAAVGYLLERAYTSITADLSGARVKADFNPIGSYIDSMFGWVEKSRVESSFLMYFYYLTTTQVKLPISNQVFLQTAYARIRGLIHEGLGQGLYTVTEPVDGLTQKIHAVVLGTCVAAATAGSDEAIQEQKKNCQDLVLRTLLGKHEIRQA